MSSISPVSPLTPVSPMSPAKTSHKPPHVVLNQPSSSLYGMEIAVPSPMTPEFRDFRASSSKALPSTPMDASFPFSTHSAPTSRKESRTYTNLNAERPRTPRSALQDEVLSSRTFLAPPGTRSSTSRVPDKVPLRPQLTRDAQTQGASDSMTRKQPLGDAFLTEWKAPDYEYSDDEYGSSLPASRKNSSHGSWAPSEHTRSAEERAKDYTSVLPAFAPEAFCSESDFWPSEMSARITDVFDESLMPAPLVLTGNSEDRKLSSQFSSSDSEVDSLHDGSRPSLRSRAKKAFNSRKASQERKEKAHADSKPSQHSQGGELSPAKRASLQSGIDDMYNTLTGLCSPTKPKMKHDSTNSKSKAIARDLRCQATAIAADQKSGKKSWDSLKSLQRPALKKDDSMGKKLASVLQNGAMAVGFDKAKERKMKNEE
ncbi:hypothetical protein IMSHALPRED_000468 [Imshaugia aleurites]|uniref:Uncharacterized protein n=1 Tax=Imshaugia aleurites TaxID=172621 RepID=A0A8H3IRH2_9LECA|nr:hypothetical protein IMSHALPRED_000468 [Imshaugia aleurites]